MKAFLFFSSILLFTSCAHFRTPITREPSAVRVATPADLLSLAGRYQAVGTCEIDGQEVTGLRIVADRSQPGVLNLIFFDEEVWMHQVRAGSGRTRDFSAPFTDAQMEWSTSIEGQVLRSTEYIYRKSEPTKKVTMKFTIALAGRKMSLNYESNAPDEIVPGKVDTGKQEEEEDSEDVENPSPPTVISGSHATKKNAKGEEVDVCRFFRR